MNYPLMSVAIPVYNHAAYIEACLESVVAQTYPELEIVVIDDGSTDNSFALTQNFLERHRARFRRVTCISRPNRGVSATSNECISACTGAWVHLLGSDDALHPAKIMKQWEAIQHWGEPDLALVYADAAIIDQHGNRIEKKFKYRPPPGPDHQAYAWLLHTNHISNPTLALRREAFLAIGGFDEKLKLEDWDCWLRLSARYPIARLPEIVASYRIHPANTSKNQTMMLQAMFVTFAKFLRAHGDLVAADIRAASFRKNLHRFWRWAAHNDRRRILPRILFDAARSHIAAPKAADYERYAGFISQQ